ncbi:MAG TPA: hypothetical protein ENJ53_10485 [Phaeodactylibacter sp.]|nr:hypothetical protein [Phaeodactylibacter sp.]
MLFKKLINFVFYSNLWIAVCATATIAQTQFIFTKKIEWNWLMGLVFFATLFLYALHRIISLSKVDEFSEMERYSVIQKFKNHISFYALAAGVGGAICFWNISRQVQLSLIIPGIISMGYVLPLLSGKKRLRDLNHIKIFLIAVVWAWVTVFLPALEIGKSFELATWLMIFEKALFIFAITLPFDIRDLKVDAHNQVRTIPAVIGVFKTKLLASGILVFAFGLSVMLWLSGNYDKSVLLALLVSYLSTSHFIYLSDKIKHDYFYTGLMDGTMILQFLLVLGIGKCF